MQEEGDSVREGKASSAKPYDPDSKVSIKVKDGSTSSPQPI
jgi:hypothetical protein